MRSRMPVGLLVVSCRPDGSFESIQCHDATGYCWCVDRNGNELAGTRQWGKPNCTTSGMPGSCLNPYRMFSSDLCDVFQDCV